MEGDEARYHRRLRAPRHHGRRATARTGFLHPRYPRIRLRSPPVPGNGLRPAHDSNPGRPRGAAQTAELRIGDGLIRIGDGDGILLTSYRTFTATRVVDCCVDAREPTHNGTGTGRSTDATGPDAHVASPNAAHAHYRVCENSLLSFVELSGFEKSAARVCVSSHSRRADVHSPQSVYPPHQCAASPRLSARLWRREPSCVDVRIPPRPLRALSAPHTRTCPRLVAWHTARKG